MSKTDKEVLGYARQARGLGEEIRRLNADSLDEDLQSAMRRADGLREEMMASKAMKGVEVCVAPLVITVDYRHTLAD